MGRIREWAGLVLLGVGLGGCGDSPTRGGRPSDSIGGAAVTTLAVPWDAALASVPLRGRVTFSGSPPEPRAIDMRSEPGCLETHDRVPVDGSCRVGPDGGLADVFVYVAEGLEGWEFPVPSTPVRVEQEGCLFRPPVVGIQVGQLLRVANRDGMTHNVHLSARRNPSSNHVQPAGAEEIELRFDRPEVMASLRCDLHGWMRAEVGVTPHPFHTVSAPDGRFDLGRLPMGEYVLSAHHGRLGAQRQSVRLSSEDGPRIEFVFQED